MPFDGTEDPGWGDEPTSIPLVARLLLASMNRDGLIDPWIERRSPGRYPPNVAAKIPEWWMWELAEHERSDEAASPLSDLSDQEVEAVCSVCLSSTVVPDALHMARYLLALVVEYMSAAPGSSSSGKAAP